MRHAFIDSFGNHFTVQIGAGLFDLDLRTLAAAVALARRRGCTTVHLPMAG